MFDIPFLLTGMHGEPDFKIRTTAIYMYNMAFQGRNDYSYAAAASPRTLSYIDERSLPISSASHPDDISPQGGI